jgi:hypothetical protein
MITPGYPRIVLSGLFVALSAVLCWRFYPGSSALSLRDALKDSSGLEAADAESALKDVRGAGAKMPDIAGKQVEAEARPLARATAEEAAEEAAHELVRRLDKALALNPDVKMLTRGNIYQLSKGEGGNADSRLEEAFKHILEWLGQSRVQVETIRSKAKPWALEVFGRNVKNGYVVYDFEKIRTDLLLRSLEKVQQRNALRDFKAPAGINLEKLHKQWWTVREHNNFDMEILYPVAFSALPSLKDLGKAFPLRGARLTSAKWKAIEDFAEASDGPEGDENFKPIASALKGSGIRQRFYFSGGGEYRGNPWSTNILLVIDEHNQAWGFRMGYSE